MSRKDSLPDRKPAMTLLSRPNPFQIPPPTTPIRSQLAIATTPQTTPKNYMEAAASPSSGQLQLQNRYDSLQLETSETYDISKTHKAPINSIKSQQNLGYFHKNPFDPIPNGTTEIAFYLEKGMEQTDPYKAAQQLFGKWNFFPDHPNKTFEFYEAILLDTESIEIHQFPNPPSLGPKTHASVYIKKVITLLEWAKPLLTLKNFSTQPNTTKLTAFHYLDYMKAWTRAFDFKNDQNRHSHWWKFHNSFIKTSDLPNWFLTTWWNSYGFTEEFLPTTQALPGFKKFCELAPDQMTTRPFIPMQLYFAIYMKLPWISYWNFEKTNEQGIPAIAKVYYVKWWNKANESHYSPQAVHELFNPRPTQPSQLAISTQPSQLAISSSQPSQLRQKTQHQLQQTPVHESGSTSTSSHTKEQLQKDIDKLNNALVLCDNEAQQDLVIKRIHKLQLKLVLMETDEDLSPTAQSQDSSTDPTFLPAYTGNQTAQCNLNQRITRSQSQQQSQQHQHLDDFDDIFVL